ncbi:MAG: adenine deaminase [Bacteroidales bacterium]|nr:adenine deaminase [Bacteroidales bacterium]
MDTKNRVIEGNIVDVVAGNITPGRVVVSEGRILSVEADPALDGKGMPYVMPGFVDSHIHIESTLMVPENYARLAVANGVVAAVCDPHEIANILGVDGISYMIGNGKRVRFNFAYMAPSCVPSTPFETAGASVDAVQIRQLMQMQEIAGLAEMMNVPGVVYEDKGVMDKLMAAKKAGKPVDGHAPKVTGDMLEKYVAAGISTDHECSTYEEAHEKISLGVRILIREGSAACDFESLYPLIKEYPGMTMFCSDDMYPDDVSTIGYINGMVRRAVGKGMPLWDTLECACVTPVRHYGLKCGMLQKGDPADFIVVDDLEHFNILSTYIQGYEVYDADRGVTEDFVADCSGHEAEFLNNFNAAEISPSALEVRWCDKMLKVIKTREGSLLTEQLLVLPEADEHGNVATDPEKDVAKIVVYDRYAESVPQVAFISGFGLRHGAMASTIAHDCHNIIAVGCNDDDLAAAINLLVREKGGIVVCCESRSECLPLPVAGLMNVLTPEETALAHVRLKAMAKEMGCTFNAPFMTMSFMALPVIPELKLTDKGLFDGKTFSFTSLWS